MKARDEILSRLQAHERQTTTPPQWQTKRRFDDLAHRFSEALTAAKGEVYRAANLEEGIELVGKLLREMGARKGVVNAVPPFTDFDVSQRWPDMTWHVVSETAGDLRSFCAEADVGLSGADAALAETGSVIVSSGPHKSRLATLLPSVHLVLLPTSSLTTDIFTWTAARDGRPPANMIIISGPSKTADIEQTMAIGVHGPKRFIVVLYND